jgi:hypothetical protein
MSVGLPGVGLSGVFFVLSALVGLPLEIRRTIQGRSSLERWAVVLRHLAMAVAMIIVLVLAYSALHLVLGQLSGSPAPGHDQRSPSGGVATLPMVPLLVTLGLVLALVGAGKLVQLRSRAQARRRPAQAVHPVTAVIDSGCVDRRSPAPARS